MRHEGILLDEAFLTRLVYGAAFLGSGGGGSIKAGLKFVDKILRGRDVKLLTFPILPKHQKLTSCIACDIGSINEFDPNQDLALEYAFQNLQEYFDFKNPVKALFPIETGAENSLAPIALASKYGLYVVDGDGAGRAVPTLPLSSFSALGKLNNFTPVAIASGDEDVMLVSSKNQESFDKLLRPIAGLAQFKNSASLVLWPDNLKNLSKKCIQGTITRAMYLGQLLEGIRESDKMLIKNSLGFVNKIKGTLLAKGRVDEIQTEEESGFSFATIKVKNQLKKDTITITAQNENLIAYSSELDGPIATAPDSICYLNSEFWPLTNSEIKKGDKIFLIGVQADKKILSTRMIDGFREVVNGLGYAGRLDFRLSSAKKLGSLILSLRGEDVL